MGVGRKRRRSEKRRRKEEEERAERREEERRERKEEMSISGVSSSYKDICLIGLGPHPFVFIYPSYTPKDP